jgi:tetratricopeptide (TPR) repeat protein
MKKFKLFIVLILASISALHAQTIKDGVTLLENENYGAAMTTFNQIAAKDPKNAEAIYYIGETFYKTEQYDKAKAKFDEGFLLNNKSYQNQIGSGKIFLDKGNIKEAEKAFSLALRITKSKDPKAYALIGTTYMESLKPSAEKAVENLTKARDLETKNPKWFVLLGDAFLMKKDAGNAMTNYEFAEAKDKNNPEVYLKQARIWSQSNLGDKAINRLEECIKIAPNYALAYKDLIEMYTQKRDYAKVTEYLKKYVELAGDDFDAKERLVKFLAFQAKDYDNAIAKANEVLKIKPDMTKMYRWLAWSYFEKAVVSKSDSLKTIGYQNAYNASKKLMAAMKPNGKLFDFDYTYLAKAAGNLGKYDEVEKALAELAILDSSKVCLAYDELAKSYYKSSLFAEAYKAYGKKIKSCTNVESNDLYYQGFSAFRAKMYKECDTVFTKYIDKAPKVYDGYYWRAKALNELDDANNLAYLAKGMYEKVIEVIGTTVTDRNKKGLTDAFIYMAYYYAGTNDFANGIAYCDKALGLDPQNTTATNLKTELSNQKK